MNLVVDIGNSRTKIGWFSDHKLTKRKIDKNFSPEDLQSIFQESDIERVILSSSGSDPKPLMKVIPKGLFHVLLDHHTPLPIKNDYATPETLGRDRLAGAVGAHYLYPGKACLSIDIGTCITYDLIDESGTYLGGAISPGIGLRFRAMNSFTANLPLVKRQRLESPLGYNTVTSMASGAQNGCVYEMEGYIAAFREKYDELVILLSGGDTSYFVSQLKSKIFAHPNLVLTGLNQILEHNAQASQ